jgi:hypothetical protein
VVIVGAVLIGLLIDALKDLDLQTPDSPGPETNPPALIFR